MVCTYLVKVGLQEVYARLVLEKSWPVILLEFLLAQYKFNVAGSVVNLALLRVNLLEELKFHSICCFLCLRVALEVEVRRLDIESDLLWVDIRYRDCEVDVVFLSIRAA